MKNTIINKFPLTGKQQQVKLVEDTVSNDTFFPKGVHIRDIDRSVIDEIKRNFEITSEGVAVPILDMFSIQRYTEFMKTWQRTDNTNTIQLPFMCLVREPTKVGTNLGKSYNVPASPTFNLWRRPIVKNGRPSVEYYQIPQPVNVDCGYVLHIFSVHQETVNKLDELILFAFSESQHYMLVNGHHMPLKLESMESSDEMSNLEKRKYYHKTYTMVLKGYLLDEKYFKKLSSIDKISIQQTVSTIKSSRECVVTQEDTICDFCLNFKFNRKSGNSKTYKIPLNIEFSYDNQSNSNDYGYFLNGVSVSLPFQARIGDEITVAHNINYQGVIDIRVCGKKL